MRQKKICCRQKPGEVGSRLRRERPLCSIVFHLGCSSPLQAHQPLCRRQLFPVCPSLRLPVCQKCLGSNNAWCSGTQFSVFNVTFSFFPPAPPSSARVVDCRSGGFKSALMLQVSAGNPDTRGSIQIELDTQTPSRCSLFSETYRSKACRWRAACSRFDRPMTIRPARPVRPSSIPPLA